MSKENAKKLLEEIGKRPELQKKVKELEAAAQKMKMEGLAKVAADLKLPFTVEELATFMGGSGADVAHMGSLSGGSGSGHGPSCTCSECQNQKKKRMESK